MGTHVGTKIPVTNGVSMDYAGKPMKTREELRFRIDTPLLAAGVVH